MKMLFSTAVGLVAALAVLGLSQAAGSGAATNLAPNPSFESNPSTSYYTNGNATFTWATDAAHTGTHSLKIQSTAPTGTLTRWMSQTAAIPAGAGTTYTASAYLKIAAAGGSLTANVSIDFWDSSFRYLGVTADSTQLTGTPDWTLLTATAKAPAQSAYIRVEFRLFGPGTLWADDVSVTAGAAPAPPTISGSPRQGQFLTTTLGDVPAGADTPQIAWQRCNPQGENCTGRRLDLLEFDDARFTATYLLSQADVGFRIRSEITVRLADGSSAVADSAPTAVVTATSGLPTNTALPQITGPTPPDYTMTATTGTWAGAPTSFSYQWYSGPSDVTFTAPVAGETGAAIRMPLDTSTDVALRVVVVATNAAGSARAVSARAAVRVDYVVWFPPHIAAPDFGPATFTVGSTLRAVEPIGNNDPQEFTQATWLRCSSNGLGCFSFATGFQYVLTSADVGHRLRVIFYETRHTLSSGQRLGFPSEATPVITDR